MNRDAFWGLNVRCSPWTHIWTLGPWPAELFLVTLEPLGSSWLEEVIPGKQAWRVTGPTFSPSILLPGLRRCGESRHMLSLVWALLLLRCHAGLYPLQLGGRISPSSPKLLLSGILLRGEKTTYYSSFEQMQTKGKKPGRNFSIHLTNVSWWHKARGFCHLVDDKSQQSSAALQRTQNYTELTGMIIWN